MKTMELKIAGLTRLMHAIRLSSIVAFVLSVTGSAVSAETLMMPNRDMLMGASEVVWGITTHPNGVATTYTIDFGDGVITAPATVTDRSYIALNHTYALSGVFTATLTVTNGATTETATVTLNVYNSALLSPFDLRNLNVNRAIQNGLRYLWYSQSNRTTFNTNNETSWSGFVNPFTALAVLAFENHGYRLPNSDAVPVGIYPKYVVRRGFNYVLARLTTLTIGVTPAGNDPCISVPAPVCSALSAGTTGDPGYENGIVLLPFAGSGALNRTVTEVAAANVNGKTFGEILQRMVNASIWGQNDSSTGRGGWYYTYNSTSSDGSTNGWELLALLDSSAAGANVPAWVKTEWANALANGLNNDGSYDYQADANRASSYAVNVAKAGVGVQGMFFAGRPNTDPDFLLAQTYIGNRWNNQALGQSFACGGSTYNKGCAYGMFNVYKGFKLFGVTTLPGVNRAAGPGTILADDWYADYVDYLVANQTAPTSTTGGNWSALYFSSQTTSEPAEAALALLILSPVALVLPDETLFSTVGLTHGTPPTTDPQTNPVTTPAGTHTVTAFAQAANGNPVPGATVNFDVLTGPNSTASGSGTTGADGKATFTYTDNGGAGTDTIQAFIGALGSNVLVKNWVVETMKCDTDGDRDVDLADLLSIRNANGQAATGLTDPRDGNSDMLINVADARYCQLRLTK
jgi:hypothetical protein